MMVKRVAVWACVAGLAAAAWGASAGDAVPRGIVYQGVLSDPLSGPLSGTQRATFSIFADASGGDALWSLQKDVFCGTGGVFHAWLPGDDALLEKFSEPQRLLEVQVDGHGDAIAPRIEFTSVPQAVLARYARQSPLSFAVAGGLSVSNALAVEDGVQFDAGASFGDLTVDGDAAWTNAMAVTVTGAVVAARFEGDGIAPVGSIVMWMDAEHIPAGWALCNGQETNGITTPDLRNRFPVGVGDDVEGNTYGLLDTGGADEVTLTTNQLPKHSHSYTTASNRTYNFNAKWKEGDWNWWQNNTDGSCQKAQTGSAGGNNGQTQPHENRPPYLAVCFIIRVE